MAAGPTSELLVERADSVLLLTLNRQETLNSLSEYMLTRLRDALTEARDDDAVRAVILTGAGRSFSSGGDLATHGVEELPDIRRRLRSLYAPVIGALREMEKPVIAAVNGVAAGAGMSLALACDFRLAATTARFVQVFVRRGLIPDAGSTFFLPRLLGLAAATELVMCGDDVDAHQALRIGLVNQVVPDAELLAVARELAERLATGPYSLGLIKRALNLSLSSDLHTQLRHEEDLQALAMQSADYREGVAAFKEKRAAQFKGR